jgi:hypothetical protein
MFADHINVLITDSDVGALQNKVDQVIVELKSLFQRNDLKINVHKTVVISLHSRQKKKVPVAPQVTCSTMNLFYRAQTKFLGIYTTEKLQ